MDGYKGQGKKEAIRFSGPDKAELAYVTEGAGDPVVFVHGALSDYRTWTPQIAAFSADHKVVSYSRRWHFPCERPESNEYTRSSHSWDLILLLESLGLKRAHLVGHSYGASVALITAQRRPDLVRSLVLGEASPFTELLDEEGFALLAEQKRGFAEAEDLARQGEDEAAAAQFLRTIVGADVLPMLPDAVRSVVLENSGTMLPMLETYYASPRLGAERLARLECPVLIVTGEFSPRISRVSDESIARSIPGSSVAVLEGASHGLQLENPEGFNDLVRSFLDSIG